MKNTLKIQQLKQDRVKVCKHCQGNKDGRELKYVNRTIPDFRYLIIFTL